MIPKGADVEIFDSTRGDTDMCVVTPNKFVINGTEVLIPADANIELGHVDCKNPLTIRVTMYVNSLTIRKEGTQ